LEGLRARLRRDAGALVVGCHETIPGQNTRWQRWASGSAIWIATT
jgi:hypothetical protein